MSGSFRRDTIFALEVTDHATDALEDRVSAIEEVLAARWPRRLFLRRRLARRLRASAKTYAWAGDTFAARRAQAMSEDIHRRYAP